MSEEMSVKQLCLGVQVFAGMTSAEPLASADILKKVFIRLLTKTHNAVQLHALRGLFLWKSASLIPYKVHLIPHPDTLYTTNPQP